MRGRSFLSSAEAAPGPRPLTRADVEAFLHVAADADGRPVPDGLRAFAAGAIDDVLRIDGDRLVVLGVAGPRYYAPIATRAALEDAECVWRVVHGPAQGRSASSDSSVPGSDARGPATRVPVAR